MLRKVQVFLATGFGSGYSPWAPGTVGSVVAFLLLLPFASWINSNPKGFLLLTLGVLILGVWTSRAAEKHFGDHDSGKIVIDEFFGYFVSLLWVPYSLKTAIAAFILFRLFDINKVPPANIVDQRVPGPWGVMLDDMVAGIYANLALQLLLWQGWI